MQLRPRTSFVCHRLAPAAVAAVLPFLFASPVAGQQSYVTRYDAFIGYAYLDSPHISLAENGFQFQAGVRPFTWLSLGVDYSRTTGDLTLTPSMLTAPLQQQLGAELAQLVAAKLIPPTYALVVPANSVTQTFAGGPQLSYRHWERVTLFIRPSIGAIREVATPHPGDAIAAQVATQLAPGGYKLDWTAFYGFGGGIDLAVTRHLGLRVQADFVHDHLFSDTLADGRNTVRFSIGPSFNFGRNIVK
jgi:hypothetical protein